MPCIDLGISYGQGFLFAHPGSPYPISEHIPPPSGGDAAGAGGDRPRDGVNAALAYARRAAW